MLIVGAVHYCFAIGCKEVDMEHWMNAPLRGKFQSIIDRGHHLDNFKRSMASCHKFGHRLGDAKIFAF